MRRFELQEGTSSKFWEVSRDGTDVTTSWGRIGTAGQSKTKSFPTEEKAKAEHDALVREKTGKGYHEVGGPAAAASPAPPPKAARAVAVPAPAPTPPPAPAPPPAAPPVDDGEPFVAWTDTLRRRAHPRRSATAPAPRRDAAASFAAMQKYFEPLASLWQGSPTGQDPELGPLLREACAALATPLRDGEAPTPRGAAVEGVAIALLSFKASWNDEPPTAKAVAYWVETAGLPFAVEALAFSLDLRAHGDRKQVRLLRRSAQKTSGHTGWSGAFESGTLGPWYHLRRALATAPAAEWEAARRVAERLRDGADVVTRIALAYLFPDVTSWAAASLAEDLGAGPHVSAVTCLLTCLTDPGELKSLAEIASTYTLPSIDSWKHDVSGVALSMVEGAGPAAVPALEKLMDRCSDTESRRDILEALALISSDEAFAALAKRLESKDAVAAASEAIARSPRRAARVLAAHAGRGQAGQMAESLLGTIGRRDPSVLTSVLPSLPEASRHVVESVLAKVGPAVVDARTEDLPAVLATPPWLSKKPRSAGIRVLALPALAAVDEMVWSPGERESWLTKATWAQRNVKPGDDAEVLRQAGAVTFGAIAKTVSTTTPPDLDAVRRAAATHSGPQIGSSLLCLASRPLALALWESLPPATWSTWDYHERFLATFELDAIPGLVRLAEATPAAVLELLQPFRSSRLAPAVALALASSKKARPLAQRWLLVHSEAAAVGLVPVAVGPYGKARDAASAALRFLAANDREPAVHLAAERYGAEAAAAVNELLDFDPLALFPARLPKLPGFFQPAGFTRPLLSNGRGALPLAAVEHLGTMLAFSRPDEPYAGLDVVKESCDPGSLAAFAWDLFSAWLVAGAPSKESWAFTALGSLGDDASARKLAPMIRAWPGEAAHARAVAGLDVLAAIGTDVALMHLHGIAQKVKFKGLQEKAREKIELVAERRGLTVDEMADRLVPDLGLDDDGSLTLDFGPRRFVVGFDELLRPFVKDDSGKRVNDLPKPGKSDDPEKAAAAQETWKALKKDVKTLATQQIQRLELLMGTRRRLTREVFETFFVGHPLMRHLVRRLVWTAHAGDSFVTSFRVAEDGTLANVTDDAVALPEGSLVGLAHSLDLPGDLAARWGGVFGDYEILQPFKQLGREAYVITEAEKTSRKLTRVDGLKLPTGKVLGLEHRGWRRGQAQDGGVSGWYEKRLPGGDTVAYLELDPGIIAGMPMEFPEQTLGAVTLDREGAWPGDGACLLGSLDPMVFSELVRDLESLKT